MAPRTQPKQRNIVRWSDDLDKALLLWVNCTCIDMGIKIPYDQVARRMGSAFTEGGIVQHISKLRSKMAEQGQVPIPPPPRKGAVTSRPSTIYARRSRSVRPKTNPKAHITKLRRTTTDRKIKRSDSDMELSDQDDLHTGDEDDEFLPTGFTSRTVARSQVKDKENPSLQDQRVAPTLTQWNSSGDCQSEKMYRNLRVADQVWEQERAQMISKGLEASGQAQNYQVQYNVANKYNLGKQAKDEVSVAGGQSQVQGQSIFDFASPVTTLPAPQTTYSQQEAYAGLNTFNLPDISEAAMAYQLGPTGWKPGFPELNFTDFSLGHGMMATPALPRVQNSQMVATSASSPAPTRNHSMNSTDSASQAAQLSQETTYSHDNSFLSPQPQVNGIQSIAASCNNTASMIHNTYTDALPQLPELDADSLLNLDPQQETDYGDKWNSFSNEIGLETTHWDEASSGLFGIEGFTADTY